MSRYLNIIINHIFEDTIIENHEFSTADIQWNRILELERGKGDHCHLDGMEVPYSFTGVELQSVDITQSIFDKAAVLNDFSPYDR